MPKAYFIEGQLKHITGTAFTPNPYAMMEGGYSIKHAPTRAYLLKNVWMLNGSIYTSGFHEFILHHRSKLTSGMYLFPPIKIETEINDASIYSTYDGNEYFYDWLVDDCSTYQLAQSEGVPVTSDIYTYSHALEYETALEMNPYRTNAAYMKNAVFFDDDWGNNKSKHERLSANRTKLLSKFPRKQHSGVFILRRDSGVSRLMLNEIEIAEQLQDKYGFCIVDVTKRSAAEIISSCVGAQILIGIEGSHLTHGIMVLQPGTSVITLQPPNRFSGVLKMTTDMEHIHYGFVVGIPKEEGFYINLEEIERTIDLLPH